jgi:hypothetical protein
MLHGLAFFHPSQRPGQNISRPFLIYEIGRHASLHREVLDVLSNCRVILNRVRARLPASHLPPSRELDGPGRDALHWMRCVLSYLFPPAFLKEYAMKVHILSAAALALFVCPLVASAAVKGVYLESRTCQVYTGPCFANSETDLAGKDAIMAWGIEKGDVEGVDVSGLNVVLVVRSSNTLGHQRAEDSKEVKSVVLVDERATDQQRDALLAFARRQSGKAGQNVVLVEKAPINVSLELSDLTGSVTAGKQVTLVTRKARPGDCICSNEVAYYPPLAKLENFVPGVTVEGSFTGKGLGTRWSIPNNRSAYMGLFAE